MAEIQRADPRRRKLAVLGVTVIALGEAVLVAQFQSWLTNVQMLPVESARASLTTAFSWCVGIGTVTTFLGGCHFWWWGRRVRRALRFPLPRARVLRDTVVLEGQAAASRGMVIQLLGGLVMLCAVGLAVGSWWILRMLGGIPG